MSSWSHFAPTLYSSSTLDGKHGEAMFRHACRLGLEGIVSKRVDSRYKSGPMLELGEGEEPTFPCLPLKPPALSR